MYEPQLQKYDMSWSLKLQLNYIGMGNSCCGLSDPLGSEYSFPEQKKTKKRKMNYNRPTEFTKGVSIRKNPETGLYQGVPKEWVEQNQIDINADTSKTVVTSHFSDSIRPVPVLPSNILNKIQTIPSRKSSYTPSVMTVPPVGNVSYQIPSYSLNQFKR